MTQHQTHHSSRVEVLRALVNLAWTGAIVLGAPLLLARTFGYPLPHEMPDWGEVVSTPLQLVDPHVIVNALACLGWITWSIVLVYVLIDFIDLARGVGHRVRRIGPASVVAGKLVASIALILSLLRQQPSASVPAARVATVEQLVEASPAAAPTPLNVTLVSATKTAFPTQLTPPAPTSPASRTTTYVVQRGDSLWRIAEQQLGDGFRWREIHQLNQGLITNPDLICSGWVLTLPHDAASAMPTDPTPVDADPTPAAAPASVDPQQPTGAQPTAGPAVPNDEAPTTTPSTAAPAPADATTTTTSVDTTVDSAPPPASVGVPAPAPTSEAPTPSTPAPATEQTAQEATTAPAQANGLPLWLRALGFDSRDDYEAWVKAHPEALDALTPTTAPTQSDSPTTSLAALAASTFAAGLVAAAVTRSLDRRRHRILNRRPLHAPLPPRNPALRAAEHTFRSNTGSDPAHQLDCIDTVLRFLTRELGATHDARPNLLLVRAVESGVELLWETSPAGNIPARVAVDPAGSWLFPYPDQAEIDDLRFELLGEAPYCESLVTVGDTSEGPVLVNLSALDTLDIAGDAEAVDAWLAAVELELEAHSWATHVDVRNGRTAGGEARIGTAIYIADSGTAHPYVQIKDCPADATRAAWTFEIGRRAARLSHHDSDIALDLTPVGVDPDLSRFATLLLLEADFDPYQPQVDDESSASDESPSFEDGPGPLAPPAVPDDNFSPTAVDAPTRPAHATDDVASPAAEARGRLTGTLLVEPQPEVTEVEPSAASVDDPTVGHGLHVTLLGQPTVSGWTTPPKGNRADEIIVYLAAARPEPVHRDRLMEALWNGQRVKPKALFNHLAAIRRHADDPEIITTDHASYRLAESVASDWDEFRALADRASKLDGRERLDCFRHALDLVKGKPFDFAEANYGWASGEGVVSHIEVAVTDLAAVLARDAVDAGDSELAIFAARKGLLACPWLLRMYGYIIEAHALNGDAGLVEHTWREAVRVAGDEELPPELVDSYEAGRTR